MKTILCPVDFTSLSDRLLQYTANLAKDGNCKIYLVSTQAAKKKEFAHAGSNRESASRLDEMHDYVSGIQHVPCGVVEETLSGNLYKKLGTLADRYDIMAMMIKTTPNERSAKDLDLHKIIHETLAPILVIPDRFTYKKINRLLYAYDYKHESEPPLMQLHWLADWFDAAIVIITLLPGDTSIKVEDKLKSIQQAIKNSWKCTNPITFETIVYPDVPTGLEHYLGLSGVNDLLVLSINHQNMLERFWHKSVVKGVLKYSKHPYLIIHK